MKRFEGKGKEGELTWRKENEKESKKETVRKVMKRKEWERKEKRGEINLNNLKGKGTKMVIR